MRLIGLYLFAGDACASFWSARLTLSSGRGSGGIWLFQRLRSSLEYGFADFTWLFLIAPVYFLSCSNLSMVSGSSEFGSMVVFSSSIMS